MNSFEHSETTAPQGQVQAVWRHKITCENVLTLRTASFPLLVIHGRHDIVTPPVCGASLAVKLKCPFVLLEGAHFLTRDQAPAINQLLAGIVFGEVCFLGGAVHALTGTYVHTEKAVGCWVVPANTCMPPLIFAPCTGIPSSTTLPICA